LNNKKICLADILAEKGYSWKDRIYLDVTRKKEIQDMVAFLISKKFVSALLNLDMLLYMDGLVCFCKSQEIFRCGLLGSLGNAPSLLRCSLENLVKLGEILIKLQDGCHIPAPIAVVRSRPNCH